MRYLLLPLLAVLSLVVSSSDSKPESAQADSYKIDSGHTGVVFKINHLGVAPFYGRFNDVRGSFSFDANDASKSSIEVIIKTESIDTNSKDRDKHLVSADFFDAKQFPELKFTSSAWKKVDEKTFEITGQLSIHGVTRSISFPARLVGMGDRGQRFGTRCGFDASFTFKRSDFDMNYFLDDEKGLGNEVTVMVGLEGIKN